MLEILLAVIGALVFYALWQRNKVSKLTTRNHELRKTAEGWQRRSKADSEQAALLKKQLNEREKKVEEIVKDAESSEFNHLYTDTQ